MCLIIAREKNSAPVPSAYISAATENNPDGFGIVGKDELGQMHLSKDLLMSSCEKTIREYESANMDFIAHFRFKTHGAIDVENTHPFKMLGQNYLAHNGVVGIATPNADKSDTWHLVEAIKQARVKMSAKNLESFFRSNEKIIGSSKFAMLGSNINLTVFGHELGIVEDKIWYSNEYSLIAPKRYEYRDAWDSIRDSEGEKSYAALKKAHQKGYCSDEMRWAAAGLEFNCGSLTELSLLTHYELCELIELYPDEISRLIRREK